MDSLGPWSEEQQLVMALRSGAITRKQLLHRASALGVGVSAAGLLAACGGGDDDAGGAGTTGSAPAQPAGEAQRGGQLVVGVESGGQAESLNPTKALTPASSFRCQQIFDSFVRPGTPGKPVEPGLVLEWVPNKDGTVWDLKLRPDVTWHDGKDFTADDLIYLFNTWTKKTSARQNTAALMHMDRLRKLDPLTLRVPLKVPQARFYERFLGIATSVTQKGQTDFTKPIGTGPFMFESFQPGKQSVFKRNPNYWDEGRPYLDSIKTISIADANARLNALLSGEVDVVTGVPFTQAKQHENNDAVVLIKALSQYPTFYLRVDQDPFKDVRVRQALRLVVDREALINGAMAGFGEVRNDLMGYGLRFYADDLPQREQDIEQAKSLLKQAGAEGLSVTLRTSPALPGFVEAAQLYAQQAKAAGVKVNIKQIDPAAQFNPSLGYLTFPFAQGVWPNGPTLNSFYESVVSNGPYNETHWDNPQTDKWVREASSTLDEKLAGEIWHQIQKEQYDSGGNIFWGQTVTLGAASRKVGGVKQDGWQATGDGRSWDWWKKS